MEPTVLRATGINQKLFVLLGRETLTLRSPQNRELINLIGVELDPLNILNEKQRGERYMNFGAIC